MTAINFHLAEHAVFIVADTLVTGPTYQPAFFTAKVHPVPHWNGVICGTGSLGLITDWLHRALGGMLAVDLIHLNEFAPASLRDLHTLRGEQEAEACTTTIYHFGYDRADDAFKGYAYRSTNGFESELLEHGTYTKPGIDLGSRRVEQFPNDFVAVCRDQRDEQDALPKEDRVFIGGQIIAWMMERVEIEGVGPTVRTTIVPAFEFDDIETALAVCVDRLSAP